MKNVFFFLMLLAASVSAQTMKFSGMIKNPNSDKITITGKDFKQVIPVAKDGTFSATFAVPEGLYDFYDGGEYTELYLKNGFDLYMDLDTAQFDESIVYKGKGEKENNFLARNMLDQEALEPKLMAANDNMEQFSKIMTEYTSNFRKAMTADGMDPGLKTAYDERTKFQAEQQKKQMEEMKAQMAQADKLNGTVSPGFDYENHKGGKTKLDNLRGKYVYIDTWATWCGPCIREIPAMKEVEKKYHGKNIQFVSISIDEKKDYEKWKKFVADKELGGIQLYADNAWNSAFMVAYGVKSIPRFILIGPDGKVISANAPRPSSPELITQLEALLE